MIKIAVICPSEIAFRRFMPAIQTITKIKYVGVGITNFSERFEEKANPSDPEQIEIIQKERDKAQRFMDTYGGKVFSSYKDVVSSEEIDAVYIPLPPALHYKWAKLALENGKHVLVEKPSTLNSKDTGDLIKIAKQLNLAIHENYMFVFHKQISEIMTLVENGELGLIRLYRIAFGFPRREINDFRYNKKLGGGALIDAGGYTIKLASMILKKNIKVKYAQMNFEETDEVDLYGSAALVNNTGVTVQVAYGMDNDYKCELEIWGSKGTLYTGRILTAPAGFVPSAIIKSGKEETTIRLSADDTFKQSVLYFLKCIEDLKCREQNMDSMFKQAKLVDEFKKVAVL